LLESFFLAFPFLLLCASVSLSFAFLWLLRKLGILSVNKTLKRERKSRGFHGKKNQKWGQ